MFNEFIVRISDFNFNDLLQVIHFTCRYFAFGEDFKPTIMTNELNNKTQEDCNQIQTNNSNLQQAFDILFPNPKLIK